MDKQAFIAGYMEKAAEGRNLTLHDAVDAPARTAGNYVGDKAFEALKGKRGILTERAIAKRRPKQLEAKEKRFQALLRNKQPGTKFTKAQKKSVVAPVR